MKESNNFEIWGKTTTDSSIVRFLKGPQKMGEEIARLIRIFSEFYRGFRILRYTGPCVTVFGSARFTEEHKYYHIAQEVGEELARAGFTVITGGGPGIMEAANRGAKSVGGFSIGCNIELPTEQIPNPYLDQWITFRYFFIRKVMLVKYSYAFIILPGGFGTLDELFETVTLVQTGKIDQFPIILMGKDYWGELTEFVQSTLVEERTISETDARLFLTTDSAKEAVDAIREIAMDQFGLTYGPKVKRPRR